MNLKDFKEFDIDVLITCKSLDEGFDYSFIDAGLILNVSSSSRQRIQRMGRILRLLKKKYWQNIYCLLFSEEEDRLKEGGLYAADDTKINWVKLESMSKRSILQMEIILQKLIFILEMNFHLKINV